MAAVICDLAGSQLGGAARYRRELDGYLDRRARADVKVIGAHRRLPLAEARVHGRPVIARDTPQNREIAGTALCGYTLGDGDSLRDATERALTSRVPADPDTFDPDAYFDWMLKGTR